MGGSVKKTESGGRYSKALWIASILVLIVLFIATIIYNYMVNNQTSGVNLWPSCVGQPSFNCNGPMITTYGTLNITFSQTSGATFYNTEIACLSTTNSSSNNATYTPLTNTTLKSGQQVSVTGLICYLQSGKMGIAAIGTKFTGRLDLNYTKSFGAASVENPWYTINVAVFQAKVS